ncbi:MAG: type I-E CRISPR-associated protein Cas7/Cse4/CasC [Geminicoccaceae bacterium]|nr:type I-E CRISPR-associated protein Cas7/Cse4/CasC [Geminicoccaceae bacterium]
MNAPRFIQIHTLHSYPGTLLNRDDAGLAKRLPFGGVERLRISSQCLKRHWRMADDDRALGLIDPAIGTSTRSRRTWKVLIRDPLVVEGLDPQTVDTVLLAMQALFYGVSKKAKSAKGKEAEINLERGELVVLGRPEIDYLTSEARRVAGVAGGDEKAIQDELKPLKANFHALRAGAGIDAAMFGRFVSGDRDARVDAAVHVAHAFTVDEQASEPDYFTAVDDLQAEEQGSGAGHLNTADLTSGVYYGYVVIDVPLLVSNLEGCRRAEWLDADRTLAAKTVESLLHLIAKVTPGAKKGSTAPYDYASLVLVEAGNEQPRTLANAFMSPVRGCPLDARAADAISGHIQSIDKMYESGARRWLSTRHDVTAGQAATVGFGQLAREVAAAIAGGG